MEKTAAILHTTPATIEPLRDLARALMPDVIVRHYLDDSLLPQINRDGRISREVRHRFFTLVQCAALNGPDAMMCACSSVGELAEQANGLFGIPCLRIDEPMARMAAAQGGRVTVCATLPSTLGPTLQLIRRFSRESGRPMELNSRLIPGAGELLSRGDLRGYEALLRESFLALHSQCDLVVLAQASMARALPEALWDKFLSSPESGMKALAEFMSRTGEAQ